MMWNPPWVLPLTVPFAILPIRFAHLFWVAIQLGLTVLSVRWLLRTYGGPPETQGRLLVAAMTFPPTVYLIMFGQIGGLCLIGVAGFLYFHDRARSILAGLCVALTAIKPHLLFAFGLYLVLDALVSRRGRAAVLIGASAIGLSAGFAWLINPHVYADYFTAMTTPIGTPGYVTVREWQLPLASFWLRMWIAPERFWVQFVPMALVAAATSIFWWRSRGHCDWLRVTPVLVLLSLLTAPYGGWLFDLVLLLIPVVCATVAFGRTHGNSAIAPLLKGLIALNLLVLVVVPLLIGFVAGPYIWFTPLVGIACWLAMSVGTRRRARSGEDRQVVP
jgi:hypothetical protein